MIKTTVQRDKGRKTRRALGLQAEPRERDGFYDRCKETRLKEPGTNSDEAVPL